MRKEKETKIMPKLPLAYAQPDGKTARMMQPGETCSFLSASLSHNEDGDLFLNEAGKPLDPAKEAKLIANALTCVLVRRDPDGFVLILRPRNRGQLKLFALVAPESFPIVRIEEASE